MRLIFMDEAGISNPKHEPFLVVVGVIVHADRQAKHLENALRRIREKHCPDAPKGFTFHATHIFSGESGNRYFARDRWPREKRWAILDDLVALFPEYGIPIAACGMDRAKDLKTAVSSEKERQDTIHKIAFLTCCMRADWWLRHHTPTREAGMLIAEDNAEMKSALRELQNFGREPGDTDKLLPGWDTILPFRRIIDTLHFAGKNDSALLQLADVAAFVCKRNAMHSTRGVPEGRRFYAPLHHQLYEPVLKVVKEQPS